MAYASTSNHYQDYTFDPQAIHDVPLSESQDHELIRLPVECKLFHLVGDQELQLASGPLCLLKPVPVQPFSKQTSDFDRTQNQHFEVLLILQVGIATFPINRRQSSSIIQAIIVPISVRRHDPHTGGC